MKNFWLTASSAAIIFFVLISGSVIWHNQSELTRSVGNVVLKKVSPVVESLLQSARYEDSKSLKAKVQLLDINTVPMEEKKVYLYFLKFAEKGQKPDDLMDYYCSSFYVLDDYLKNHGIGKKSERIEMYTAIPYLLVKDNYKSVRKLSFYEKYVTEFIDFNPVDISDKNLDVLCAYFYEMAWEGKNESSWSQAEKAIQSYQARYSGKIGQDMTEPHAVYLNNLRGSLGEYAAKPLRSRYLPFHQWLSYYNF